MGLFRRRKLTPEEQEEKSIQEKEWAEKCYRAGEEFSRKYGIGEKISHMNKWANKYPKSFFITLTGVVAMSFVLNLFVIRCEPEPVDFESNIKSVTVEKDLSRKPLTDELNSIYKEMDLLNQKLEKYTLRDSLTRQDSVQIANIIRRMKNLNAIIEGKESALEQTKNEKEDDNGSTQKD